MNAPNSPRLGLRTSAVVWFMAAIIIAIYFLGLAASAVIPFGPPMSLLSVARKLFESGGFPQEFSNFNFGIVLTIVAILLVAYHVSQSERVRFGIPIFFILVPMFFSAVGPMGPAALIAIPLAPIITTGAIMGALDGEFYAEGFIAFCAVGWWMILWSILFFRELRRWAKKPLAN